MISHLSRKPSCTRYEILYPVYVYLRHTHTHTHSHAYNYIHNVTHMHMHTHTHTLTCIQLHTQRDTHAYAYTHTHSTLKANKWIDSCLEHTRTRSKHYIKQSYQCACPLVSVLDAPCNQPCCTIQNLLTTEPPLSGAQRNNWPGTRQVLKETTNLPEAFWCQRPIKVCTTLVTAIDCASP